jgi:small subunit ribosomal protein S8
MALNDPIADLLTRIRNAAHAGHEDVSLRHSNMKEAVARILSKEGFIGDVEVAGEGARKQLVISIKYASFRQPPFTSLDRTSKGGRRIYLSHKEIKPVRQGMGISILTTAKGVMTDAEARQQGVGGEVVCTVW